jgi:hypothetical protein
VIDVKVNHEPVVLKSGRTIAPETTPSPRDDWYDLRIGRTEGLIGLVRRVLEKAAIEFLSLQGSAEGICLRPTSRRRSR